MPKSPRTFAILVFCLLAAVVIAGGSVFYIERVNNARRSHALACARVLGLAAIGYAQDHNDHFPDAGRWEQELKPYLADNPYLGSVDVIHPPAPVGGTPRQFSLNPALAGKLVSQVNDPANIWLFYESLSPTSSASDNLAFFPKTNKNGTATSAVVFADGHVYTQGEHWKSTCQSQNATICGGGMPN